MADTWIYGCKYTLKETYETTYKHGIVLGTHTTVIAESSSLTRPTLEGLIQSLGEVYCLDIDDLFLGVDDVEPVEWVSYERYESAQGDEPSEHELDEWQRGALKLYRAEYSFSVEKRLVAPIPVAEFTAAGFKTH